MLPFTTEKENETYRANAGASREGTVFKFQVKNGNVLRELCNSGTKCRNERTVFAEMSSESRVASAVGAAWSTGTVAVH